MDLEHPPGCPASVNKNARTGPERVPWNWHGESPTFFRSFSYLRTLTGTSFREGERCLPALFGLLKLS